MMIRTFEKFCQMLCLGKLSTDAAAAGVGITRILQEEPLRSWGNFAKGPFIVTEGTIQKGK